MCFCVCERARVSTGKNASCCSSKFAQTWIVGWRHTQVFPLVYTPRAVFYTYTTRGRITLLMYPCKRCVFSCFRNIHFTFFLCACLCFLFILRKTGAVSLPRPLPLSHSLSLSLLQLKTVAFSLAIYLFIIISLWIFLSLSILLIIFLYFNDCVSFSVGFLAI